jgi:transcriptional regulator with XRE-family HTH domain
MDRAELADFLRTRRQAVRPQDVGLPRTRRRRTGGLRREEVAALANMSTDYYSRIEQRRGPRPSEPMLAAIARALRLSPDERDHLFRLAGYAAPPRRPAQDRVSPALISVLDRMDETPAQVMNGLGETLAQNRLAVALIGDQTGYRGMARALAYRWFTDPGSRRLIPEADRAGHGRTIAAQLRAAGAGRAGDPRTADLVGTLRRISPEFAALWSEHPVRGATCPPKRITHPKVGTLDLRGHHLLDPDGSQSLVVFTAEPGSDSEERLRFLSAVRDQLV